MNKIKLNKNFYSKSSLSKAISDFKDTINVTEDKDYYFIFSEDKKTLLEFSNYVLATK